MEVFLSNVPFTAKETDVVTVIASALHADPYTHYSHGANLLKFRVFMHPDKQNRGHAHSGRGSLTILDINAAAQLLRDHGGHHPPRGALLVKNRPILCEKSRNKPRPDILAVLAGTKSVQPAASFARTKLVKPATQASPIADAKSVNTAMQAATIAGTTFVKSATQAPALAHKKFVKPDTQAAGDRRTVPLTTSIPISSIQFGWECRDGVFSLEWSRIYAGCVLSFEDDKKVMRFRGEREGGGVEVIDMKYSQVRNLSTSNATGEASVFLFLSYPPSFQTEVTYAEDPEAWQEWQRYRANPNGRKPTRPGRRRHSSWDTDHARVVPYVSTAIRLVCRHPAALAKFRKMASHVGLQPSDFDYPIARRNLFSREVLDEFHKWLADLSWPVAFHLDEMHKKLLLDTRELLSLREPLHALIAREGRKTAASVVRYFAQNDANSLPWKDYNGEHVDSARDIFERRVQESQQTVASFSMTDYSEGVFDCLHVLVTPTCVLPKGMDYWSS